MSPIPSVLHFLRRPFTFTVRTVPDHRGDDGLERTRPQYNTPAPALCAAQGYDIGYLPALLLGSLDLNDLTCTTQRYVLQTLLEDITPPGSPWQLITGCSIDRENPRVPNRSKLRKTNPTGQTSAIGN